ncbi:hypothetical protein [Clostridium ihumii]|uniref:hypothetical protein n=1 Tax=Clostridium ihumii TaxID=1470356 RepID=UPI00058CEE33|nr:hypothetical protein [Clostridium ihumii]
MEDFEEYISNKKETLDLTEEEKEKLKRSAEYNSYLLNKKLKNFKDEVISSINKIKQLLEK